MASHPSTQQKMDSNEVYILCKSIIYRFSIQFEFQAITFQPIQAFFIHVENVRNNKIQGKFSFIYYRKISE